MIAIFTLVTIMFLSLLATRLATAVLMHTGMSRDNARFQARSAWTNSGYTTSQSECMVKHPQRRKVLMVLMLLGNVGLATTTAAFIIGMTGSGSTEHNVYLNAGILVAGIGFLLYLSKNRHFTAALDNLIDWVMLRFLRISRPGCSYICHFSDDYKLLEVELPVNHQLLNRKLGDLKTDEYNVKILQVIGSDGDVYMTPDRSMILTAGMKFVVFGNDRQIEEMLNKAGKGEL